VFVAEDNEGVAGYILGPADTRAFEAQMETRWWPVLRAQHPDVDGTSSLEERMRYLIHHPAHAPDRIVDRYTAHLHINLLPRLRGQGIGQALVDRWRDAIAALGATGAHLTVGERNTRAVRFYQAYGFRELERPSVPRGAIVLGMKL